MSLIDVLLVAAALAAAAAGIPAAGAPLLVLGLVVPTLRWVGGHRDRGERVAHLVPPQLATAYRDVCRASALEGVLDVGAVVRSADDAMLEVAAVLGGRSPRGGAQRRFVATRVRALRDTAAELTERHETWLAARRELDELAPDVVTASPARRREGVLVTLLLVTLAPAFLAWDTAGALARCVVAFVDGVALRARTAIRLVVRIASATRSAAVAALRRWNELRTAVAEAAAAARARFVAARVRLRLRLRG
jgi:hypothetical protein